MRRCAHTAGVEGQRVRRCALVTVLVVVVVAVIVGRVAWDGTSELAAGRDALAQGNRIAAQKHFLYAARWYLPFTSWWREGVQELNALGGQYASEKAYPEAVAAFDDARGALYSTAWLFAPDVELLGPANAGYASALAGWKKQLDPAVDVERETARYLALAEAPKTVSYGWSLAMGLSFIGYVGLLGLAAWKWDAPGFRKLPVALGAAGCFSIWILSMFLV